MRLRSTALALLSGLVFAAGCSSVRPWVNAPLPPRPLDAASAPGPTLGPEQLSAYGVLALSGGGARAAAFSYGVMQELKATRVTWQGRVVSATDLSLGMSFEFTQPQFDQICSDLSSVPLSFAVTASSAVPVLLSPMTLRNHAAECERPLPAPHLQVGQHGHQSTLLLSQAQSYADATHRPYVHLVDGGLADNIGVRRTLDSLIAQGGLFRANAGPGLRHAVHRIFVIAVNSERDPAYRIDLSDRTPTTFQVLDALMFGSGSRSSRETLALLRHLGQQWQDELRSRLPHPDSPWADDLQLHVVTVNLRDVRDAGVRDSLLHVPTAFTIAEDDVTRLIAAGRKALRESAEFQAMVASMQDAREAM